MHWTLTRTDTDDVIKLHPQFEWVDEFDWTPIAQSEPVYTLTGAMALERGIKQAGRPITLDGKLAVLTHHTLKKLLGWAGLGLALKLGCPDGRIFAVVFDRSPLSDVKEFVIHRYSDKEGKDLYHATIRFLTI